MNHLHCSFLRCKYFPELFIFSICNLCASPKVHAYTEQVTKLPFGCLSLKCYGDWFHISAQGNVLFFTHMNYALNFYRLSLGALWTKIMYRTANVMKCNLHATVAPK
jgi:hypothetical protein